MRTHNLEPASQVDRILSSGFALYPIPICSYATSWGGPLCRPDEISDFAGIRKFGRPDPSHSISRKNIQNSKLICISYDSVVKAIFGDLIGHFSCQNNLKHILVNRYTEISLQGVRFRTTYFNLVKHPVPVTKILPAIGSAHLLRTTRCCNQGDRGHAISRH